MKSYFSLSVVLLMEKSAMSIVSESGGHIHGCFGEGGPRRVSVVAYCLYYCL